jgi:hypothetical protein
LIWGGYLEVGGVKEEQNKLVEKGKQSLILQFDNNIVIKSLIKLIPWGVGSVVDGVITKMIKKRLYVFFNELAAGKYTLTPELIENEEFLHCYFCTVRAVVRTYREEKIRYFARLLSAAIGISEQSELIRNVDEFEEYLSILDELTYKEIGILKLLYDCESKYTPYPKIYLDPDRKFWIKYFKEVQKKFQIANSEEFEAVIIRIRRTGCLRLPRTQEVILGKSRIHYSCATTPLFHKIVSIIQKNSSDNPNESE